jgi:putative transcriptional regulator
MAKFHPEPEMLMEYAAGSASEPISLVIATHVAVCPECRSRVAEYEELGGALLEDIGDGDVDQRVFDKVFSQLDAATPEICEPAAQPTEEEADLRIPNPLRSYLGRPLEDLAWKKKGPVEEFEFLTDCPGVTTRLLKIKSGKAMPRHTHEGMELTLVLAGGFTDQGLHFGRGDIEVADTQTDHAPVADEGEDCYCLAVNDKRLRLTGPLSRFVNPFIRL